MSVGTADSVSSAPSNTGDDDDLDKALAQIRGKDASSPKPAADPMESALADIRGQRTAPSGNIDLRDTSDASPRPFRIRSFGLTPSAPTQSNAPLTSTVPIAGARAVSDATANVAPAAETPAGPQVVVGRRVGIPPALASSLTPKPPLSGAPVAAAPKPADIPVPAPNGSEYDRVMANAPTERAAALSTQSPDASATRRASGGTRNQPTLETALQAGLSDMAMPDPSFAAPTSKLGKAAYAVGSMAAHPVSTAASFATAPFQAAWTLGRYTRQAVDEAKGKAPVGEPISRRDAAFAAGQLLALGATSKIASTLDAVFGEKMAKATVDAINAGESPTSALLKGYAARAAAHAALGAAGGATFTPDDPEVGAILGAAVGGIHAASQSPHVAISDDAITRSAGLSDQPNRLLAGSRAKAPTASARVADATPASAEPDYTVGPLGDSHGAVDAAATAPVRRTMSPSNAPRPTSIEQGMIESEIRKRARYFGHDADEAVQLYRDELANRAPGVASAAGASAPVAAKASDSSAASDAPPPGAREYVPESSGLHVTEPQMLTRNIARGLKTAHPDAIAHAAPEMAQRVPPNAVLVPLPDHTGNTAANSALANAIAQHTDDADVADVLGRSQQTPSSHELRQKGKPGLTADEHEATMVANGPVPKDRPVVFVDNVETTGATAEGARRALKTPGAQLLTFAKAPIPAGEVAATAKPATLQEETTSPGATDEADASPEISNAVERGAQRDEHAVAHAHEHPERPTAGVGRRRDEKLSESPADAARADAGTGREGAGDPDKTETATARAEPDTQGAADDLATRPHVPGPIGRNDQIHFSDGSSAQTRYRVIEADDLQPSHDPTSFAPNPKYPKGVQGREYSGSRGAAARQHVEVETGKLRPAPLLDAGGGTTDGPPVITPHGLTVAGNQRAMMLKRAARVAPDRYQAYRDALDEKAASFDLDPEQVKDMKAPVLVRELADPKVNTNDVSTLSRLNQLSDQTPTKTKDALSDALGRAKRMQEAGSSLAHFADTVDADETIREYLDKDHGRQFVRKLFEDGVIAPQERGAFVNASGEVTTHGKDAIESALQLAAIGDPDVIHRAPPSMLRKIESAIPAIIQANATKAYTLMPDVQSGLDLLSRVSAMKADMQARGETVTGVNVDYYLRQQDLFGNDVPESVKDFATFLERTPKSLVTAALREYANRAREATEASQSDDMFGHEPETKPQLSRRLLRPVRAVAESSARGTVAEQTGGYAAPDRFYSRLERAIENAPFDKGTGKQWAAALSKNVAKGEREWTGVEGFLAQHPDRVLTRREVADVFERGKVALHESTHRVPSHQEVEAAQERIYAARSALDRALGGVGLGGDEEARHAADWHSPEEFVEYARQRSTSADRNNPERLDNLRRAVTGMRAAQAQSLSLTARRPKYGEYAEPGGDNYREIVVHLNHPEAQAAEAEHERARNALNDFIREVNARHLSEYQRNVDGRSLSDFWTREERSHELELYRAAHEAEQRNLKYQHVGKYESSHWDGIDNPLLHLRLTDRTLPNGEKVLFAEELQSDWHQQGREHGYGPLAVEPNTGEHANARPWRVGDVLFADRGNAEDYAKQRERTRVPDAPMKKTEDWMGLAMKRVIDEAVRGGYDRVAWTTGDQQAARYDLSKQVGGLYYEPGSGRLTATSPNEMSTVHQGNYDPKALPSVVGKDVAKKLLAQPVTPPGTDSLLKNPAHILRGDGLKVGGMGMRTFYDEMIPSWVKDYGKKMGVKLDIEPAQLFGAHTVNDAAVATAAWNDSQGGPDEDLTDSAREIIAEIHRRVDSDGESLAVATRRALKDARADSWLEGDVHSYLDAARVKLERASDAANPSFRVTPDLKAKVRGEGQSVWETHSAYDTRQLDLFRQAQQSPTSAPAQAMQRDDAEKAYGSVQQRNTVARELAPFVAQLKKAGMTLATEREAFIGQMQRPAWANLTGADVSTPERLRAALTVMRHPLAESMNVLFKNADGHVVDHFVYSSGALNLVAFDLPKLVGDVSARAKALGVETVTLAHNHPSGDPTFSHMDAGFTHAFGAMMAEEGVALDGHMTIDHDTAQWATPNGRSVSMASPTAFADALDIQHITIPGADAQEWKTGVQSGNPIVTAENVAGLVRDAVSPNARTVFYLDAKGRIVAAEPRSIHEPLNEMLARINAQRGALAARDVVLAASPEDATAIRQRAQGLRADGEAAGHYITDVLIVSPNGTAAAPRAPTIGSSVGLGLFPAPDERWRAQDTERRTPDATRVSRPGLADGVSGRRLVGGAGQRGASDTDAAAGGSIAGGGAASAGVQSGGRRLNTPGRLAGGSSPDLRTHDGVAEHSAADQTATPDFRRWFRDSKVVDADGRPLVVYHGTTESFDRFALARTGQRMHNRYGRGALFFTSNPTVASDYATVNGDLDVAHPADRPNVMPVYLSLQSPLEIDARGRSWIHVKDEIARARKSHDGAIVRNVLDHARIPREGQIGPVDVYVAFDPKQVKSATGNSGAFDPAKASIVAEGAHDYGSNDEPVTGVKNAVSATSREGLDMGKRVRPEPRTQEQMYDAGKALDENDPTALPQLLTELRENPERIVGSKEEAGLLLKHRVDLDRKLNELVAAKDAAVKANDEPAEHLARLQLAEHREVIKEFVKLAERTGTASGRALAARKMMSTLDYSLSHMEAMAEAAKGQSLTQVELDRIRKLHDELVEKLAAVEKDAAEARERAAIAEADLHHAELRAAAMQPIMDRVSSHLGSAAEAAKARIRARGLRAMAGLDPEDLADHAIIGAAALARGISRFNDWSQSMRATFGDEIAPHLRELFDASNARLNSELKRARALESRKPAAPRKKAATGIRERMKERLADGASVAELRPYLRQLALQHIHAGITEREPLLDALHKDLLSTGASVTRAQTRDALSGYGDFKTLDKSADKVKLREVQAESQKLAQLEALKKGEAPLASGFERQPPNDETRRLTKQVNDAKKAAGIGGVDDATRLKSALSAAKTRTRNAIADLRTEIDTGQRIVRGKHVMIGDAELEALRAELTELRKAERDIFGTPGLTDEQRLQRATAAAKRTAEMWAERVDKARSGTFATPGRPRVMSSPELDALRAKADAAREEYNEMKSLDPAQQQLADEKANQQYRANLARREAELLDRLAREDYSAKPLKPGTRYDAESLKRKAEVEEVKQRYQDKLRQFELANRTVGEKARAGALAFVRAGALSWPTVIAKLTSVALSRVVTAPLSDLAALGVANALPGLAKGAPRYGARSPLVAMRAEAAAQSAMWTDGLKDSGRLLMNKQSRLALLHDKHKLPHAWFEYFGSLHSALKEPVKRAEYARALYRGTVEAMERGENTTDDFVKLRLSTEAYLHAQRAVSMNDNVISDAWKDGLRRLERKDKTTGKANALGVFLSTALKTDMPIMKAPTNVILDASEFIAGLPMGAARAAWAYANGIEDLKPVERDSIIRMLSKGLVGMAIMALYFYKHDSIDFGGFYQPGEKRKPDDIPPNAARVGDKTIPKELLHNPLFMAGQYAATIARVAPTRKHRRDEDPAGYGTALVAASVGLLSEIPIMGSLVQDTRRLADPATRNDFVAKKLASVAVPGVIQWIAQKTDTTDAPRKPDGLAQHLEYNLPALRTSVPIDEKKQRKLERAKERSTVTAASAPDTTPRQSLMRLRAPGVRGDTTDPKP